MTEAILKSLPERDDTPVDTYSKVFKMVISCDSIQRMISWMIDKEEI